jgi:flagellar biogenesis protein FliO
VELAFVGRLLAACVVIGLVLAVIQLVARRALRVRLEGGGGKLVTLFETTYLPGAASVHVLRVLDRYYVVGRGGSEISTLCEIPADRVEAHLATQPRQMGPATLQALSRCMRGGRAAQRHDSRPT